MKKLAVIFLLFVVASCGGSGSSSDASSDALPIEATGVARSIAKIVCDPKSSLAQKSGSENKDSWQCKRGKKQVDFDIYISQAAKQKASDEALSLLGVTGSMQTWADIPILCGNEWTMGVADLETRDEIISELTVAGIDAATC